MSSKVKRFSSQTSATSNIGKMIENASDNDSQVISDIPLSRVFRDPKNNRKNQLDWENPAQVDENAPNADKLLAELESVRELAGTINAPGVGLLQPITVTRKGENFHVVTGHRRVLAYKLLGRQTIPAIIRVDLLVRFSQFVENVQRKDIELDEALMGMQGLLTEIGIAVVPGMPPGSLVKALINDCKMSQSTAYRWAELLTAPEVLVDAVKTGLVTTWSQVGALAAYEGQELEDAIAMLQIYQEQSASPPTSKDDGEEGNSGQTTKRPSVRRPKDHMNLGKVRNPNVLKEVMARVLGTVPDGVNWADLQAVEKAFKKMLSDMSESMK